MAVTHYEHAGMALQSRPVITLISGIVVTLTNPLTIIGWIAVAGDFFMMWGDKLPDSKNYGLTTIIAIMTGVLIWFMPLIFIISKLKRVINSKVQRFMITFSGVCLIAFGMISLYTAIKPS